QRWPWPKPAQPGAAHLEARARRGLRPRGRRRAPIQWQLQRQVIQPQQEPAARPRPWGARRVHPPLPRRRRRLQLRNPSPRRHNPRPATTAARPPELNRGQPELLGAWAAQAAPEPREQLAPWGAAALRPTVFQPARRLARRPLARRQLRPVQRRPPPELQLPIRPVV